jgi:ABC-type Fe3+-hydroxamate transport system substrate-binding protein
LPETLVFTDPTGHVVNVKCPPKRIISLVPSLTETLYDLRLEDEVVGITRFCIHPREWFLSKKRVGGTKDFKLERIIDLKPDLIIANKEENTREEIEELRKHFPVWTSDISTIDQALNQILQLGSICGRKEIAEQLIDQIRKAWEPIRGIGKNQNVLYFIWKDPWMIAGSGTYVNSILQYLGLNNVSPHPRYPIVSKEHFDKQAIDLLLFSSEPYPFKESDTLDWRNKFLNSSALLVDGEAFSWYGSRMLRAPKEIKQLLQ